jgi:SagB-type dehydrogenase family enzyme
MKVKDLSIRQKYHKLDTSLSGIQRYTESTALLYHENSKLTPLLARKLGMKIAAFDNPYTNERASQPYKQYPGRPFISFEEYTKYGTPEVDIFNLIQKRRSLREYRDYPISVNELYLLLQHAYGITARAQAQKINGTWAYRAVPSAGALYPLEIYVAVLNGQLEHGLYHYHPARNGIELVREGDFYEDLKDRLKAEPYMNLRKASAVVFITGVYERVFVKYGDRGYRFILQEAGFVAQNLSLISDAIGLGACMAGSFLDDQVDEFLGNPHPGENILNVLLIGKPPQKEG